MLKRLTLWYAFLISALDAVMLSSRTYREQAAAAVMTVYDLHSGLPIDPFLRPWVRLSTFDCASLVMLLRIDPTDEYSSLWHPSAVCVIGLSRYYDHREILACVDVPMNCQLQIFFACLILFFTSESSCFALEYSLGVMSIGLSKVHAALLMVESRLWRSLRRVN